MSLELRPKFSISAVSSSTSATDNAIARYDGITGSAIQTSELKIMDTTGSLERVSSTTINIGTDEATVINIGRTGATVNVIGTIAYVQSTNTQITDSLITLNKGGAAASAGGAGLEFEENSSITGYIKVSANRNSFSLLAPNTAGIVTITPGAGGFTIDSTLATSANKLSYFAATSSSELASVISDETGSGSLVFADTPTLITPVLGVASATTINKVTITAPATSATLTLAQGSSLITSGANSITLTSSGATNVTLPTTGTLATLAGAEALTNKSINGLTITSSTGTLTVTNGKTFSISNTLTFTGTDSSSVAFGAGGTVVYTSNKLSALSATSSSELAGVISDETGSGSLVFGTSPSFTTSAQLNAQAEMRFADSDSSNYIALKGGATIASNFSLVLPTAAASTAPGDIIINDGSGNLSHSPMDANQNYIYNGDMDIWQSGTAFVSAASGTYSAEGFRFAKSGTTAVIDLNRSTSVPTVSSTVKAFNYSLEVDVTTADNSVAAGDSASIAQFIEGNNFKNIHQKQITISFWVYATITGTSCLYLRNSASDRSYIAEYTVSSTNTWEYKTVTVTLDTSGTWLTKAGTIGLRLGWSLMSGSTTQTAAGTWTAGNYDSSSNQVNHLSNTANFFRLTGVKVNLGPVATPFSLMGKSSQGELAICQRYFLKSHALADAPLGSASSGMIFFNGLSTSAVRKRCYVAFRVEMCAAPTVSYADGAGNASKITTLDTGDATTDNVAADGFGVSATGAYVIYSTSAPGVKFSFTANARL